MLAINNNKFSILTPEGFKSFYGIQKLKKECIKFYTENCTIKVSTDHKFIVNNNVVYASDLTLDDYLETVNGLEKILKIEKHESIDVYDPIEVESTNHSYFANNILNHNCQFLGSSNTVVNVDILKNLFETVKSEPDIVDLNERLKIYERPIKGATYVLGVDPSKGVGKDDSVVQILKVDNLDPIHVAQVAVFKDNKTDTYEFSELVNRLSYYYNNARIFIENNAEGAPVVSHLWWTYENMNLYSHGSDPGIRASKSTKTKAVLLMKRLLENYQLQLHDQETVKQLGSFIETKGKFYGKDLPDDLVSGLYWACYAFEAKDIFDTTPNVINKKDEDDDAWGILSDATEPEEDWKWLTSPF